MRLGDDRGLGATVPGEAPSAPDTMRVLRRADLRWRLEPATPAPIAVGLFASTEHLTVGTFGLDAGIRGEWHTHAGDECGYVLEGALALAVDGPMPDDGSSSPRRRLVRPGGSGTPLSGP